MMGGESYFSVNGYSHHRNTVFYAAECLGPEIQTTMSETMSKTIVWMCLLCDKTARLTHLTAPSSTSLCQGVQRCKIIRSWKAVLARPCSGTIAKRRPLTVRAAENICSGKGGHTKTATSEISIMELFCALLIPSFYTSDFETETEDKISTQIHCQKGYTVA